MTPAESINVFLDKHAVAFTAVCRQVIDSTPPADAAYGLVWFQVDTETWNFLPLCHLWCDRHHGCGDPQAPHPLALAIDEPWTMPFGIDDSELGTLIFRWIARCWQAAGGASLRVPFYAHNYHTGELFSLAHSCYVQESDIVASPPA